MHYYRGLPRTRPRPCLEEAPAPEGRPAAGCVWGLALAVLPWVVLLAAAWRWLAG
jgi:hypothetical protein